jgi:hypothetical protein
MIKKMLNRKKTGAHIHLRRRSIYLLFVLFLVVMIHLLSCEQLMEKDITDEFPELLAPADNQRSLYTTQTFWWEEINGARAYNLQIVSPSFESVENVVIDTTITKNKITVNLYYGKFAWRVRAKNASYYSQFSGRSLEIDSLLVGSSKNK